MKLLCGKECCWGEKKAFLHVPPLQPHHVPHPFSGTAVSFIWDFTLLFDLIYNTFFQALCLLPCTLSACVYMYFQSSRYLILMVLVKCVLWPQVSDGASPSLRSANLSALKKRWEQAGNLVQTKPPPAPASSRTRAPPLSRPAPVTQRVDLTAGAEDQKPPAAPRGEELGEMDGRETSQSDRAGKQEEQVPTSPCASYEKPRVLLSNLKMKFERGEEAMSKVFTEQS